ncbi:MAG: cytochrome c biogenesis protein CcsA [Bacteroidia bacterium]|nr:cytochrome c biogenesis protein CcsA [Bacteroidia bacterium]MCC7534340.1 cytochrome c biogenesis protein CcsA [Bacteroidia bacterium]MCZ2139844.1 cytochrome c biogenesis protein [Bacteroidia bacterium]
MIKWWKITGAVLVLYSLIWGLYTPIPQLAILEESIRNLFYHVPMWFSMIVILTASMYHAVLYLAKGKIESDVKSAEYAKTGLLFGLMGIVTGMLWAKHTWGAYWTNDPKLNSAAIGLLMYFAYLVLRSSIEDEEKRARVSAVYNIFSFPIYIVLIFILPRLTSSLHPGNGGNPGFNSYDLDSKLRLVFYPAVLGWILIAFWVADLGIRTTFLEKKKEEHA